MLKGTCYLTLHPNYSLEYVSEVVSKDDVTITEKRKLYHSNSSSNPANNSDSSHDVTNNISSDKDQTEPIRVVKIIKAQPPKVRTSNIIPSTNDGMIDTESRLHQK